VTTLKLIKLRDTTYVLPLDVRCETCRHVRPGDRYGTVRMARCDLDGKPVHPAGRCDAWGSGKK
jgi:hypothetical protein